MKVRQGFVSNSSSSSFVLIGLPLKGQALKEYKEYDTEFGDKFYGLDVLYLDNEDEYLIGNLVSMVSSDGGGEDSEIRWADLEVDVKEMQKKLQEKNLNGSIKLYTGVVAS